MCQRNLGRDVQAQPSSSIDVCSLALVNGWNSLSIASCVIGSPAFATDNSKASSVVDALTVTGQSSDP